MEQQKPEAPTHSAMIVLGCDTCVFWSPAYSWDQRWSQFTFTRSAPGAGPEASPAGLQRRPKQCARHADADAS
eukprot:7440369-Pyramimonas_sp.AAC.1